MTMKAGFGPILEYQSDQSSLNGLDGFLVASNEKIHHEPPTRTCAVTSYQGVSLIGAVESSIISIGSEIARRYC
jgi:hypothetical protein